MSSTHLEADAVMRQLGNSAKEQGMKYRPGVALMPASVTSLSALPGYCRKDRLEAQWHCSAA